MTNLLAILALALVVALLARDLRETWARRAPGLAGGAPTKPR